MEITYNAMMQASAWLSWEKNFLNQFPRRYKGQKLAFLVKWTFTDRVDIHKANTLLLVLYSNMTGRKGNLRLFSNTISVLCGLHKCMDARNGIGNQIPLGLKWSSHNYFYYDLHKLS